MCAPECAACEDQKVALPLSIPTGHFGEKGTSSINGCELECITVLVRDPD